MSKNTWLDGVMGVVVGDALGCPVQFMEREEIRDRESGPVTCMEEHGTYDMPVGTWTDDGSMTLALLDSIHEKKTIDPDDIMSRFVDWYENGAYTPFGEPFDMGNTCSNAIEFYENGADARSCGCTWEHSNGNGSLMRILPACLYGYERIKTGVFSENDAIRVIHLVSGLTHNHLRSKIGCGLYFFVVCAILNETGTLFERARVGLDTGFSYYERSIENRTELAYYSRLKDYDAFCLLEENDIRSGGYVVDSLEVAIWSLVTTETFRECLLRAVNLGDDTDTIAAIAGGLAGLYYGYETMPVEWLEVIQRREWIEDLCYNTNEVLNSEGL